MSANTSNYSPIERCARGYTDAGQFSNIEWAVNAGGKRVSAGNAGFADYAQQSPVPDNALYRIYSMTKPLVSLAASILVEQQKLKLYHPVASYIPAFAQQKIISQDGSLHANPVAINIEHLLTHRAGLSYDFQPDCPVAGLYREQSLAENGNRSLSELVDCLAATPLLFVPGERWHYSYATDVLARVIELASGQRLDEFLNQHVLSPLGMADTRFYVNPQDRHRLMPMYGTRVLGSEMGTPDPVQKLTPLDVEASNPSDQPEKFMRGGHGLFSTTQDYCRFAEYLRTNQTEDGQALLSDALFDLFWANRIPAQQRPLAIGPNRISGYGWNLFGRVMLDTGEAISVTSNGEGGWAGAASTYFWVDRSRSMSGVIMSQYLGSALPLGMDMHSAACIELTRA